jgi:II/X family phage/plasmid replication protein
MIDTIKFYIPIVDLEILAKLKGNLMRFKKDDMKTGKVEFEFFTSQIELGSYSRVISLRANEKPRGLFLEFSLPKYEKGNNVEMIHPDDLEKIMAKMYFDLCQHLNYFELPHFSFWIIYRLDVCYNWLFKSKDETRQAIDFIKRIDYPRKKKYVWDTSVMYKGTAYSIKFYVKGAEFKKHDLKKIMSDDKYELLEWANHIVRFEVNLKRNYLNDYFKLKNVFVRDISDDKVILDILIFYLAKVFYYINTKTMTQAEVEKILFANFSKQKATRLYSFYKEYWADTEIKMMYLNGGLNRSTIYRYKKDLKEVGIGFSLPDTPAGKGILEQLVIPSENSKFDLIGKFNILPTI